MNKIELESSRNACKFNELDIGDIFIYENAVYMKIIELDKNNAIDLRTGLSIIFNNDLEIPDLKYIKIGIEVE